MLHTVRGYHLDDNSAPLVKAEIYRSFSLAIAAFEKLRYVSVVALNNLSSSSKKRTPLTPEQTHNAHDHKPEVVRYDGKIKDLSGYKHSPNETRHTSQEPRRKGDRTK